MHHKKRRSHCIYPTERIAYSSAPSASEQGYLCITCLRRACLRLTHMQGALLVIRQSNLVLVMQLTAEMHILDAARPRIIRP